MGIPFETLIVPCIFFFIFPIIFLIQNHQGKIKPKHRKVEYIVVVLLFLYGSLRFVELMCWVASLAGIYNMPVIEGTMRNVAIVERLGGVSSFSVNSKRYEIDNSYNELLHENGHYIVTYTPFDRRVIQLEEMK